MDSGKYEELTGASIADADRTRISAACARSKRVLESLLGFTLTPTLVMKNQYIESGISTTEWPYLDEAAILDPADSIVKAYRLFPYNYNDTYFKIDPCTAIHKVKLIKDNVTYKVFTAGQFRADYKNGIIKYLEVLRPQFYQIAALPPVTLEGAYRNVQLAVDATWLWERYEDIPQDLLFLWADMVRYHADEKKDLKSESIGPHSYVRTANALIFPEQLPANVEILKKYAGPQATFTMIPTI